MTDSDVVKEGAQQASSQLGDCLALGKEAALQLGSQMAGPWDLGWGPVLPTESKEDLSKTLKVLGEFLLAKWESLIEQG